MAIQAGNPLPLHKSGLLPDTMSSLFAYVKNTDLLLPLLAASLNYLRLFFPDAVFLNYLLRKPKSIYILNIPEIGVQVNVAHDSPRKPNLSP